MKPIPLSLLVVMIAGCTAPEQSGPDPSFPSSELEVDDGAKELIVEFEHQMGHSVAIQDASGRRGSVGETADPRTFEIPSRLISGSLTASWTALSPASESFYISIRSDEERIAGGEGTSPLTMSLPPDMKGDYIIGVFPTRASSGELIHFTATLVVSDPTNTSS